MRKRRMSDSKWSKRRFKKHLKRMARVTKGLKSAKKPRTTKGDPGFLAAGGDG